ncbi:ethanolamine ammonia-lyase subunit EutC [Pseudonocardia xishanensis]|uniref:Ethanolamine ammonia-lyase small subunit n=1 Tax=Pseudonocardia xishanensis TaxID=630995 RepID=A0ABP8S0M6_9PSEU
MSGDLLRAAAERTPARLALGRAGVSVPTHRLLDFEEDHAAARDAVRRGLDLPRLRADLRAHGWQAPHEVRSLAPDLGRHLLRPDLGRLLHPEDREQLAATTPATGLVVLIADGLSAGAVQHHAVPLLDALRSTPTGPRWQAARVVVARHGRVALGDHVGHALGAALVAVLIGERPGLTHPESLGVYLTHAPRPGRTDAERTCVSNVHPPDGLSHQTAAAQVSAAVDAALRHGTSGVALAAHRLPFPSAPPRQEITS